MKPSSPPLLAIKDIADGWQVSLKTVRRIIASGDLKVHRIGSQIRISPEDKATYEKLHRG
jgi:excisionase family DNA binding protein